MNCGTRGCENLWWNLPFFPFFFNFLFSIQQQCVERILCRCRFFFSPCVYILRQNSLSAATWWAMWGKKSGLLRVKSILCQFWKENVSRAWFLNLFGLHFKTFKKNPVISLDLLASEKRSEFVTSAKGSVLVLLVLAIVPYSCWRWTVASEPILPCQSWPKDVTIPSYLSPHNWCWLETFPDMGQNCLVVFSM